MSGKRAGSKHDRRHSERHDLKIRVDYSAVDSFFSEFTSNINEGGMFVETETPAALDSQVQLQCRLPELERPVRLTGRVAWISDGKAGSPPGMGIEFQDLPEETRRTINELVRRLRQPRS
jgi:uncharacterized protein (TIGR02266 family)